MREILFRGKERSGVLNHQWIYGALDNTDEENPNIIYLDRFGNKCIVGVLPETVGQYTGLTDKNGTKIFDGDIVKHYNRIGLGDPDSFEIGVIYWNEETCKLMRTVEADNDCEVRTYCIYEVIGNIHDDKMEDFEL